MPPGILSHFFFVHMKHFADHHNNEWIATAHQCSASRVNFSLSVYLLPLQPDRLSLPELPS